MSETREGRKSIAGGLINDFKTLSKKQIAAIVAGLVIAIVVEMYMTCMGFFLAAVFLYMIPHMTGVSSVKIKAILGAVFMALVILLGTFVMAPNIQALEDEIEVDNDYVMNASYDPETQTVSFQVNPGEYENWEFKVEYSPVEQISFGRIGFNTNMSEVTVDNLTATGDGWYSGSVVLNLSDGNLYVVYVTLVHDNSSTRVLGFVINEGATDSDITDLMFNGALYQALYAGLIFYLILIFSAIMRRTAEKTRCKMEADGRLYPKGYGTCKECGAMVLPGEVTCRKCGAYIDVPDEMRAKKKDFFQCSECGAEVPSDADHCPKCGAKFDEVENVVVHEDGSVDTSDSDVVCPECGASVPANADWCPSCGRKLKE